MTQSLRVFLVLLRLAIGWHFLFEGLEKVRTYYVTTKPAFTSETYLRESTAPGPLGEFFHWLPGDPVLERFELLPEQEGKTQGERLPKALEKDWKGYYDRFVAYYGLDEEQRKKAEAALDQQKQQTVLWMLGQGDKATRKVTRSGPAGGNIDVEQTVEERVKEYKATKAKDVRDKLRADLAEQTAALAAKLNGVLTDEQRAKTPALEPLEAARSRLAGLTEAQREVGPKNEPVGREWRDYDRIDWIDFSTRWGLVVVGLCLLFGLFTRPACLVGACFLLMLVLAMPPLPGAPEAVRGEGRLFVNKNVIEMLALLTLAVTPSGRWFGLDGLLRAVYLAVFGRRRERPAPRQQAGTALVSTPIHTNR